MSKLTDEQIEKILAGASENVKCYGEHSGIYSVDFKHVHNLDDLREIQQLRQKTARLDDILDSLCGFKAAMDCNDVGTQDHDDAYYAIMEAIREYGSTATRRAGSDNV